MLICLLAMACKSDDEKCVEYQRANVTDVSAPAMGSVNETIAIEVSFRVYNGCGVFERFIETENGNSRTIEVEAKYEGCAFCTQDTPIRNAVYEFTPQTPGEYELKFKSSPAEFITINLTINE
jgi:hypothetical protein